MTPWSLLLLALGVFGAWFSFRLHLGAGLGLSIMVALAALKMLLRSPRSSARQSRSGQPDESRVRTRFVEMVVDHQSGALSGVVVSGAFRSRPLASLSKAEFARLLDAVSADGETISLLAAYLERERPEWDLGAEADEPGGSPSNGRMTAQQARDILNVPEDASRQVIVDAHRRLMQRLHPDRGGSSYLATQVNLAKDVLLREQDG
jgi:hypothetical protein